LSVSSPMILMEFLLAPTVPSAPRPKNTARTTSSASMSSASSKGRDRWVTSSTMPTVKCFFGRGLFNSPKTALTIAGVNSFDDNPLATADKPVHGLAGRLDAGPHQDHDALRLWVAVVVEQVVLPTGPACEPVHHLLHDLGQPIVVGVAGLAGLEVGIGVLGRT